MDAHEVIDLYVSPMVVGTEAKLANRLDSAVASIRSSEALKRRIVGLMGWCANAGIFIGRLDQKPVITISFSALTGQLVIIPLDIPIPVGQEVTFAALSTSGTGYGALAVLVRHD